MAYLLVKHTWKAIMSHTYKNRRGCFLMKTPTSPSPAQLQGQMCIGYNLRYQD